MSPPRVGKLRDLFANDFVAIRKHGISCLNDTRDRIPGTVTMHTRTCDCGRNEPKYSSLELLSRLEHASKMRGARTYGRAIHRAPAPKSSGNLGGTTSAPVCARHWRGNAKSGEIQVL